jgi:GalNAc-alpha-(1->4)-GalNAc-alpha-(1->3)-diNAcBac-PP-undecaprenol alpha-1,4-N-acetyl-D-galactosaminyltransferase
VDDRENRPATPTESLDITVYRLLSQETVHITFVISSLSSGGSERVMTIMANYWAAIPGKKVTLITLAAENTDFYALRQEVKRVPLGLMAVSGNPWEALENNLWRLRRLRQEIRASEPDVVISFMDWMNVLVLLAGLTLNKPVVVSIRTDPRRHHIGRIWSLLRRLLYPRAHAVVVQSEEVRRWAQRFVRKEMIHTIPNPVALPAYRPNNALGYSSPPGRTVIAMGRLGPEKGYDLLVRAFAQCAAKYPDWYLVILGEGEERGRLESLAGELGIVERVSIPGQVVGPAELLRQADLFVLSSRFEGFPNALLEAMACGLPVVSTDCPSGPREIIRDGVDGVLVAPEDIGALSAAMGRLMADEAERKRLASRAVEVTERFDLQVVMGIWENILDEIVERGRR